MLIIFGDHILLRINVKVNVKKQVLSKAHNESLKHCPAPVYPFQKKYFLLCRGCYWMLSTLSHSTENIWSNYKSCPVCENEIDKFSISTMY